MPVDFVIDALVAAGQEAAVEEPLQLVDPEPVTSAELPTILSREYAGREPRYSLRTGLVTAGLRLAVGCNAFGGAPPQSIGYLNQPVRFDTRRTRDVLDRAGVRVPRLEEYLGAMVRHFSEHEDDPSYLPKEP